MKPWQVLETKEIFVDEPWVGLSVQQIRLPDGKVIDDFYQISLSDYISVYALTEAGEVIMERQYKHGVGGVTHTLPQGRIEEGEPPLASARRELLEETGYTSDDWLYLGSFLSSSNYGCGTAHFFIAKNSRKVAEPDSGDLEEMEIILIKPKNVARMVQQGEIHTLGTAAGIAMAQKILCTSTEGIE